MAVPRIALVHATPLAVDPIRDAFAAGWPQARTTNLLDDALSQDLAQEGRLSDRMVERFVTLARYSVDCGADAILFTCSAFGPAIEAARDAVAVPVLKPNEAMFDEALAAGTRFGLISTFEPSIPSMVRELEDMGGTRGHTIAVRTATVAGAMADLQAGNAERHDRLIAEATVAFGDVEVLMLAQFSMARAAAAIPAVAGRRLLTSPDSAVARLRRELAPPG
jgi:hypothetical protein